MTKLALITRAQINNAAKGNPLAQRDVVGVQEVRLIGINAHEINQTCQQDGASWPCGQIAKEQLAQLVAGQDALALAENTEI